MRWIYFFLAIIIAGCHSLEIFGTPGELKVDVSSLDFGQTSTINSSRRFISLTNSGDTAATNLQVTSTNEQFVMVEPQSLQPNTNACKTSVPAKSNCVIAVDFTPTTLGTLTAQISISFHTGVGTKIIEIQVTGTGIVPPQALIEFSDSPTLDFGSVTLDNAVTKTTTIENKGDAPATAIVPKPMTSHFRFLDDTYPGTGGACGTTLNPGDSCTLVLEFAPGVSGNLTGTVTLNFHDGVAQTSETLNLKGEALSPARPFLGFVEGIAVDMPVVDITVETSQTLTLRNSGTATAFNVSMSSLATPFSFKGGSYPGTGGTCNTSLGPNATCTIVVNFISATPGTFTDILLVDYDDGSSNSDQSSLTIRGIATPFDPANIIFAHISPLSFGSHHLNTTHTEVITITNSGELTATNLSAAVSAPFSFTGSVFPGTNGTCGATLAPSSQCKIEVIFAPTAAGTVSQNLTVSYNDSNSNTSSVLNLTGYGIPGGTPDTTFGSLGKVILDYTNLDVLKTLQLQTDGKILIGGNETATPGDSDYAALRLHTSGALDTTYGANGRVVVDLGSDDLVSQGKLQADGKLVLTGTSANAVATLRFTTSGGIDNSLDLLGLTRILIPLLTTGVGLNVSIDSDGRILIVGRAFSATETKALALRMGPLGLDVLFGLLGIKTLDLSSGDESLNVVVHDASSKIISAGYSVVSSVRKATVVRLTASGAYDTSFGSGGKAVEAFVGAGNASEILAMVLQSSKILLAGYAHNGTDTDILIYRLTASGTLDTTFGVSGAIRINIDGDDRATAIALDGNGRIVVAGNYNENGDKGIAVLRLSANGALDTNFGTNGVEKIFITGSHLSAQDLKIQTDGKIVIGGTSDTGGNKDYLVLRLLP